jgi:hypothetical protein
MKVVFPDPEKPVTGMTFIQYLSSSISVAER